jgi:hypothetical protein
MNGLTKNQYSSTNPCRVRRVCELSAPRHDQVAVMFGLQSGHGLIEVALEGRFGSGPRWG